jgi:hypothetical protein
MAASMRNSDVVARTIGAVGARLDGLRPKGISWDLSLRWERRLRYAMAATALRSKHADTADLVAVLDDVRAPLANTLGAVCRVRCLRGLLPPVLFATLRPFDVSWRLREYFRDRLGPRAR